MDSAMKHMALGCPVVKGPLSTYHSWLSQTIIYFCLLDRFCDMLCAFLQWHETIDSIVIGLITPSVGGRGCSAVTHIVASLKTNHILPSVKHSEPKHWASWQIGGFFFFTFNKIQSFIPIKMLLKLVRNYLYIYNLLIISFLATVEGTMGQRP